MKKTKQYWFKRRRYGWGWVPVSWQGWLSLGLFILVVLTAALRLPAKPAQPTTRQLIEFIGTFIVAVIALVVIGYAKGPVPRWRWGIKPGDNRHEDF